MELMERLEERAKKKNVKRRTHKANQSFGDFVEATVEHFLRKHWKDIEMIETGRPEPFDFIRRDEDGNTKMLIEIKGIRNDWDLPYFLYEVEDRGMIPCHFGAMIDRKRTPVDKEYFISVDCNLRKGGTLHIHRAKELAEWAMRQPARSTKVNTRCVEVPWDLQLKGSRQIKLDEEDWECIIQWKKKNTNV